jgi:catechol 1,2-dioxygenase
MLLPGEDEMINSRVGDITTDLIEAISKVCEKHNVTHDEYRKAIDFLSKAIDAGERSLIFDAFIEANIVATDPTKTSGTTAQVLGPFYLPNMPIIDNGQLARSDEAGERLTVSGTVLSTDGEVIKDAELDFWQADAQGRYSNFNEGVAQHNLRGKINSKNDGSFLLKTVKPAQYTIPDQGPTGILLKAIGRHPWRPAHLHVIVRHNDYQTLITQIYFRGDEYLSTDAVRAASDDLAFPLMENKEGLCVKFNLILRK